MPRDRDITMGKISREEAHEHALRRAIKLHHPFVVVEGELAGSDYKYVVVYTAPLGGERYTAGERNKLANAASLRDMLNKAWAAGHYAATVKGKKL